MSRLTEQISALRAALEISGDNQEHGVAIEAYNAMLGTLAPILDRLDAMAIERFAMRDVLELEVPRQFQQEELTKLQYAKQALANVNQGLKDEDYKIKQSPSFSDLVVALETYESKVSQDSTEIRRRWWSDRAAELVVSEPELEMQRRMPELRKNADTYENAYSIFRERGEQRLDGETAKALLESVKIIQEAKTKMIFDVPEPVQRFFTALQQAPHGGGAPLSMLTEEVISWLSEHGETANYVIRRRGSVSW